jgi:thioredoxin 1
MSEHITHVTDGSFEQEVLGSDGPVLVDYWAEWCGPCKMIAPILEEIATEYKDRLKVTKMDIDSNTATPQQYSIRGIPTLMVFKDGKVQATKVGALTKGQLKAFLDEVVGNGKASSTA